MFRKIIVALDGSMDSKRAMAVAIQEAKLRNAELHPVFVIQYVVGGGVPFDPVSALPDGSSEIMNEVMENEAERVLNNASEDCGDAGVNVITHTLFGDPRDAILDLSEEISADMIILGSSGKTGLERMIMGSVSSAVVQHSKITTMIVKGKKEDNL